MRPGSVKIGTLVGSEEAAKENGIEIAEQRDEMLEGTMMKDRRAEITEIYSTIDVVVEVEVAEGVVSEATEVIDETVETVEMTEDSQLNELQNETRAQLLHRRRRSRHLI